MAGDFVCLAKFLKTSAHQKKKKFSKQNQFLIIIKNENFLNINQKFIKNYKKLCFQEKKLKNFIVDRITISCPR